MVARWFCKASSLASLLFSISSCCFIKAVVRAFVVFFYCCFVYFHCFTELTVKTFISLNIFLLFHKVFQFNNSRIKFIWMQNCNFFQIFFGKQKKGSKFTVPKKFHRACSFLDIFSYTFRFHNFLFHIRQHKSLNLQYPNFLYKQTFSVAIFK